MRRENVSITEQTIGQTASWVSDDESTSRMPKREAADSGEKSRRDSSAIQGFSNLKIRWFAKAFVKGFYPALTQETVYPDERWYS